MQPDPLVFIPAMRRELLSPELLSRDLAEGWTPIIVQRMAETLAQLTLRYTRLPQVLRETLSMRTALLRRIQERCPDLVEITMPAVAVALEAQREQPGEKDITAYEQWGVAVSTCIRELSQRARHTAATAALLADVRREGSRLDLQLRTCYKQELERIRREATGSQRAASLPQPTDEELTAVLRAHLPDLPNIRARHVRRLPGVNSKETFFFELENHPEWPTAMVLRREQIFNPTRTFVADELDLLNDLHAQGIPVPRALIADREGRGLGAGFIVVERLEGMPRTAEAWGAAGRSLALSVAKHLARIHRIDTRRLKEPYRGQDDSAQAHVLRRLEDFYQRWMQSRIEPSVTMEAAFSWLRENIRCIGPELSLVHGDCNFRNVLLDGDRVSAILDWELAHPGCAAEDLSYIKSDVEKIMPWGDFIAAYLSHGGVPVNDEAIRYFEVWANVWRTALATLCYAGYVTGEHLSYLYGSIGHNEFYNTLDPLCADLAAL
jgi:aminoglycoside phosphotransferase (APT) family kinase protein